MSERKLRIDFTPEAGEAIKEAADTAGHTEEDHVKKAIQMYNTLLDETGDDGEVYLGKDGVIETHVRLPVANTDAN